MVLILNHTLAAIFLYYRDQSRFITKENRDETMAVSTEKVQDAILRLSSVVDFEQLRSSIRDALQLALPNVVDVVVYLLHPDSQELVSCDGLTHTLPKEGLGWECVQKQERQQVEGLDFSDPLSGLLKSGSAPLSNRRKVVCSPVVDKEDDRVIAVLLFVSNQLSETSLQHLNFIERQLIVCYKRLKHMMSQCEQKSAHTSQASQHESILSLCADLYDQDAAILQLKVIQYLCEHTQAESGFLLLVALEIGEMTCQVIGDRVLEADLRFPLHKSNFAEVLRTKQPITLEHIQNDQREELSQHLGRELRSLLCVPVCSKTEEQVIAVMCMANKKGASRFTEADVDVIRHCFKYTATVLSSTIAFQNEQRLRNQTQTLLNVARNLFTHLDDLTILLKEIMQEARNLTKAERCSVFLVEKETNELVAKVFDGDIRDSKEMQTEVRIPVTQGIAGHVATTGEILNIEDVYTHPLFYRGVDESTGFRTRNILCFPIKDENGVIIGVAQLCNKLNGAHFTQFDEEIAQAFSIYCCISIVHSLMYKQVRDAQHRSKLSNELMIYHMQTKDQGVSAEDVDKLTKENIPKTVHVHPDIDQFYFTPRSLPEHSTPLAVVSMMQDMGLIHRFRIRRETLARFVLMVKRGYRDPPYHNWSHAFAVAHFCYLLFKNANLLSYLDEIEVLALIIACLCHDIDHRGTNNSYQVASESVLAALYSSEGSVMERHHFAQTMCILNTEGCNIFENLSRKDYEQALDLMRDIILATDLAHHLRILPDIQAMTKGPYNRANPEHHTLLLCLCMTSCDLSDQTKNWSNSRKIAELIYGEFFSQGDLEKALGRRPLEMMDREKADIPDLQIGFLDGVALPVFTMLGEVFPEAGVVTEAVRSNRKKWTLIKEKTKRLKLVSNSSMDIFDVDVEDEETNGQIQ